MSRVVIDRAVVERAMKAMLNFPGDISDEMFESIRALKAALAEPAQEPVQDQRCRAEPRSDGDFVCDCKIGECPGRSAEPAQEPVAWRWGYRSVTTGEMDWRGYVEIAAHPNLRSPEIIIEPLYTAPPQRTMVPLTEEEIKTAFHAARNAKLGASQDNSRHRLSVIEIARAVEQASWEKNHG